MIEQIENSIQEKQFAFPYHHLVDPKVSPPKRHRSIKWGFEYLAYVSFIVDLIKRYGPNKVLDVGCGDGYIVRQLSEHGIKCLGIDISGAAIAYAKAFSPTAEFVIGDIQEINSCFDIVLLCEVLEHIPDDMEENFLESVYAKARPGGVLVISVPTQVRPIHPKHFRHYNLEMMEKRLAKLGVDVKRDVEWHFLCKEKKSYRLYLKLLDNRFWFFSIRALDRLEWWFLNRYIVRSNEKDGSHLIATVHIPDVYTNCLTGEERG